MIRLAAALLFLALPAQAQEPAGPALAVAEFAFRDTSGELRDQRSEHAERLDVFADTLREALAESAEVVALDCPGACNAVDPGLPALAEAAASSGADLLLVGEFHKVSTLIGWIRLAVLDLEAEATLCERMLSYRGDTDEAWQRAADFAVRDVTTYCLPG